jgi:hypothetical protein
VTQFVDELGVQIVLGSLPTLRATEGLSAEIDHCEGSAAEGAAKEGSTSLVPHYAFALVVTSQEPPPGFLRR